MLTVEDRDDAAALTWKKFRRRLLRPERFGQTLASLCWIASMLVYGISSAGDWLQLFAASAWLLANLAAIVSAKEI